MLVSVSLAALVLAGLVVVPAVVTLLLLTEILASAADNYLSILFPIPLPAAGRDPNTPVSGTRGLGAAAMGIVAMTATLLVSGPFAFLVWLPHLLGERWLWALDAAARPGRRRGRLLHGRERGRAPAAAARAGAPGAAARRGVTVRRPSVAIIGLGLVGGSLARALTRKGYRVTGIDWPLVVRRALAMRAISRGATRAEAAVRSDVVVLAAPPATNLRLLRRLARVAPPELVLTDVSSVKRSIVSEAARLGLRGFVGGHPMAGTEKRGFAASKAELFRGATWWLVPSPSARANRTVRALVKDAGARPVTTDASTHDRAMAFLSHAPQVVAWALLETARRDSVARRHLRHAGPGFRGMTRLARSPRALWHDILAANRAEVARALRSLQRALERRSP